MPDARQFPRWSLLSAPLLWQRFLGVLRVLFAARGASRTLKAPEPVAPPQIQAPRVAAPNEIFTPTRPRAGRRALVGRAEELARIMQALNEEAAHVVLYAERGRGKTSLANLAVERLRRSGFMVGRHACDAASDFDSIIRGLMRSLPHALLAQDQFANAADTEGCEAILPAARPAASRYRRHSRLRLACPKLVFVVDEFDRVHDRATRTRLADTIKLLSDRGEKLLFMIVGVSATLEQIIGQHPSIERNIAALHLPLLTDIEINEMLQRGGDAAGIRFTGAACTTVAAIARGMPYMAQLMGLRIAQIFVAHGKPATTDADVREALARMISDAPAEVTSRYAVLTTGPVARKWPLCCTPSPRHRRIAGRRIDAGTLGQVAAGGYRHAAAPRRACGSRRHRRHVCSRRTAD